MAKEEVDYTIKPEAAAPSISTADWPLLLKNYEKRTFDIMPFLSSALQMDLFSGMVTDLSFSDGQDWTLYPHSGWLRSYEA